MTSPCRCLSLLGVLALVACGHAPVTRDRLPAGPAGVFAAPAGAVTLVATTLAARGRGVLLAIAFAPWSGDADRFRFDAIFAGPPVEGWSPRERVRGSLDLHTRGVEVLEVGPAPDDLATSFVQDLPKIIHVPTPLPRL